MPRATILLCEDEDSLRRLLVRVLAAAGYEVLEASNDASCRRQASTSAQRINLLITDLTLPDGDGFDLAESLRAAHPGLQVLFMSGFGPEALAQRGIEIAARDLLEKPFRTSEIVERVKRILRDAGNGPVDTHQDSEGTC